MSDLSFLRFSEIERKHRMIMNYSADLLSINAVDGLFVFVSQSSKEILGYDQKEIIDKNLFELVHPDDLKRLKKEQSSVKDEKDTLSLTYRIRKVDGTYIWFETLIKGVADANTKQIKELICVSRDVSAQKEILDDYMENEKRLLFAQSIAHVGNWELNLKTKAIWASPESYRIYGFEKIDNNLFHKDIQKVVIPEYRAELDSALISLIKGKKPYQVEFEIVRNSDSQIRRVFSQAELEYDEFKKPIRVTGVLRDITELKAAQNALIESEAKQKAMIANISDVIGIMDSNAIATYLSPNCTQWFGWSQEDILHKAVWHVVHPDDLSQIKLEFEKLLKLPGTTRTVEFRYKCKNETYKSVKLTGTNMIDNPNIKGILLNYHDISEQKKMLSALIENEEKYRGVFSAVSDGLFIVDIETKNIIDANENALKMFGYSKREIEKLKFNEVFKEEMYQKKKDGSTFPIELTTTVFELDGRQTLLAVVKNISLLVKSENEIIETNRLLQESQKFAHIGSYLFDLETGIWSATPELMRIFGIDEFYQRDFAGWLSLVSPLDRERMSQYFEKVLSVKEPFDNVYRIVKRETSEEKWVHGLGVFELDETNSKYIFIGTIQDISEKISYEEKLQQSISLLTTTLESTTDGILVVDISGNISYYNQKYLEMWDIPQGIIELGNDDEAIQYVTGKVLNPAYFEEVIKEIYYSPESKSFDEIELLDGRAFERYSIPQYLNGVIVGRVWSFRDVTARKISELKLKESEEHFRSVVEFSQDAFYRRNIVEETYDYVSPVFEKLTGYSAQEMMKMNRKQVLSKVHHEDIPDVQMFFSAHNFSSNDSVSLEYRFLCKDGKYRWFADKFIYVKDEGEHYIYGSLHDISERRLYEEKILFSSFHDSLTGLYNRRFLDEEMPNLNKPENLPISIIVGDMNGLKLANDTFGHNVGDAILIKCAEIIKRTCRPEDIIARWGGDEFIVVLKNTGFEETNKIVGRINENCSNEQVNSIPVSISFGFETKTEMEQDINVVLKIAEDYMYKHKMVETTSIRGKTIDMMLNTLYEKNVREEKHSRRVSELCAQIGSALNLQENIVSKLRATGLVHDIGKIAINEEILNKPGRLNEIEWAEIKRHSEIGYRILSSKSEMSEVADHILMHHERLDGTGYPKGLMGDDIPMISRIIAIADAYDAMTSERSYKDAMGEDEAIAELIDKAGTQFDEKIANVFIEKVLNRSDILKKATKKS